MTFRIDRELLEKENDDGRRNQPQDQPRRGPFGYA
jgi:hypothetical protein